jgi:hypothetical protein
MKRDVVIVLAIILVAVYMVAVLVFPEEVLPSTSQYFTGTADSKPLVCFLHGGAFQAMQCR